MNNWFTHSAIAQFALPNLAAVCRFAPNFTTTKLQLFMDVIGNLFISFSLSFMKKIIHYTFWGLMLIIGACILIYGFMTYSIFSVSPSGIVYDGIGRQLYAAPLWAKIFILNEQQWPGLFWTIFDRIIFFISIGLVYLMYKLSMKFEPEKEINKHPITPSMRFRK